MQHKKRLLFSGLIALLLLFGLIAPQMAEARDIVINDDTTLAMDPATLTATTCGTVDVNVQVSEVVNLTAFHLEVTYDRTKVQVLSVTNGGFLTPPTLGELYEPTNTVDDGTGTGRILWGMAQQGLGGDPTPKTGSGNLITITLKSLATTGTTTIAIDGVKSMLVDWPEAQAIPYTLAGNATVTLSGCGPTDIALSNATVDENQPVGTLVGNLSATDPDAGDTFTYLLLDDTSYPDNTSFQIVGKQLQTNAVFDYETKKSYEVQIQVSDDHGMTYAKVFTITVNDVNEAPEIIPIGPKVVVIPQTLTFTATANDPEGDLLTWSLGATAPTDASIDATSGEFSWDTTGIVPGDYTFDVCVSDGENTSCETITVTVQTAPDPQPIKLYLPLIFR